MSTINEIRMGFMFRKISQIYLLLRIVLNINVWDRNQQDFILDENFGQKTTNNLDIFFTFDA